MTILHFVGSHGATILQCLVLMWLVCNWRDAVASAKVMKTAFECSEHWRKLADSHDTRQHELVRDLVADTDKIHAEAMKLHEDLMKSWNENEALGKELYEVRKALWIEQHGPPGPGDLYFGG